MKISLLKQKTAWKDAAWTFGLSRLMILLVSYIGVSRFSISDFHLPANIVKQSHAGDIVSLLYSWWRWDVVHYVEIAHDGYTIQNTAFFPLPPLLMHGLGAIFGGSAFDDYIAGLILANLCFYGALVLFHQILCEDFDQSVARNALFYLAFAPYGIFFFAGYSESFLLLLSLATFYFLHRGRPMDWWLAGLCGFFATLTRPTGVALIILFFVIFVQNFGLQTIFAREKWQEKLNALLSILLLPAGVLAYMIYLGIIFGNPLIYSTEQAHIWDRALALPWVGIINAIVALSIPMYQTEINLVDLIFTLIPLIVLVIGWKHLPPQYSLLASAVILAGLCFPRSLGRSLNATPRYLVVAFPIFVLLALWSKHRRLKDTFVVTSLIFFAINTILFVTQNWVA